MGAGGSRGELCASLPFALEVVRRFSDWTDAGVRNVQLRPNGHLTCEPSRLRERLQQLFLAAREIVGAKPQAAKWPGIEG